MDDCVRQSKLRELVDQGDYEAIQKEFDRLQALSRDYENRCQAKAYELLEGLKHEIVEKDATIRALLKCVRLLGGDNH